MEQESREEQIEEKGRGFAADNASSGISRRSWMFMLIIFAAMIGLSFLTQWRSALPDASFHPLKPIGQRQTLAPDFTLPNLTGRLVRLADFRGQVVLLNFWATWCPPCRKEMPSMERLYQKFRDQGLVTLAVSTDRAREPVLEFMERYRLSFPALWDGEGSVAEQYQILGLPTSYLIDRRGFLVSAEVGARDWASTGAKDLISTLLAESPSLESGKPSRKPQPVIQIPPQPRKKKSGR